MASRFVGLTALARSSNANLMSTGRTIPARAAVGQQGRINNAQLMSFRGLHASNVRSSNQGGDKKKTYLQPELIPLYAIVVFAVSAGLYSIGRHLFSDNDIRRLPEHPVDEQGNPTHKAQHRPDWKPEEWKDKRKKE